MPEAGKEEETRDGKKRRSAKSVPVWEPERFEWFWRTYPRHEDRAGAVKEWDRLKPGPFLQEKMGRALLRQKSSGDWQRGIGIPYFVRWLRNRRWEDVPLAARGSGGGTKTALPDVEEW